MGSNAPTPADDCTLNLDAVRASLSDAATVLEQLRESRRKLDERVADAS
jgi:hypothetical protein